MRKDIGLSFIFILITGMVFLKAQEPTDKIEDEQKLMEYINKINSFNNLYPQEKVYLHFDNTGYFKGEAIWFKAWVVTSEENSYSPLSKVLYVELLTPEGDIVETKKLKVVNGQADGGFILDEKLFTGFYEVRAYTKCMLNFGEETVFSRVFPVFDPPKTTGNYDDKQMTVRGRGLRIKNKRISPENKPKDVQMLFFPEGGNIIKGISNRVAFKITGKEGQSLDVTGKIYDSSNIEITEFSTLHLGMGSFVIIPDGRKYTAKIEYNGKQYSFDLPEIMPSGYTMSIDNMHPQTMNIQINKTDNIEPDVIGITFACRGKIYACKTFTTGRDGQFVIKVPKEKLPSGIIQVTMFTTEGHILAQRQSFVNHNHYLPIKLTAAPESIEPYAPIDLNFKLTDTGGNPIRSTFSLSVRDAGTDINTNYSDNIMYNLLLGSDLKGYIEDPAFYFTDIDNKKIAALDLLMLTQGWTRYPWRQMAGLEPFEIKYGIEEGLIIEGNVLSAGKGKAEEGIEVDMWMHSLLYGSSQQGKCVTEADGYFNFALSDIYGKWDMTLKTKKKDKPFNSRILINRNFSPQPVKYSYYEIRPGSLKKQNNIVNDAVKINETNQPAQRLNTQNENITLSYLLDEVTVTEKARWTIKNQGVRYANIIYDIQDEVDRLRDNGGSESTKVLDFLENTDENFKAVFDYEYTYKQKPIIFYVNLKITRVIDTMDKQPSRITQDNQFKNNDHDFTGEVHSENDGYLAPNVYDIDISEVEYIMIAENDPTVFAATGKEGVGIYIYTNESGKRRKEPVGTRMTRFYGYTPPMEYYSPDYTNGRLPDEKDFRRTLYWNPNVETDKDGNAMIRFFNNGTATDINISAEGLLNGGIPVFFENK